MPGAELARYLDHSDKFQRLAVHHRDALAGADIQELLRRVCGERQIAREWAVGAHQLLHELAVGPSVSM